MSGWAAIEFPQAGRAQDQVRMSIVKKDRGFGVSILLTGMVIETMGWSTTARVLSEIGHGEYEGWLRLRAAAPSDAQGRKLRDVQGTKAARLVTPLYPWMEARATRGATAVETKIQGHAVLLKLPDWAAPPVEAKPAPAVDRVAAIADAKRRFGVR